MSRTRRDLRVWTGPTEMEARYPLASGSPLPWKTENELSTVVHDTNSDRRGLSDADFGGNKSKSRLDAAEESTSSVFSVDDWYSAARLLSPDDIVAHEPVQLPNHVMDTHHLQVHLGLEPRRGQTVVKSLEKAIENRLENSITSTLLMDCTDKYLPINELHRILSGESVLALLKEFYPACTRQELHQKALSITGKERGGNCRLRILAILIFSRCLHHLDAFITHDIWDQNLPISDSLITEPGSSVGRTWYATRTNPKRDLADMFANWERVERDYFFFNQPRFNVPFFDLRERRLCSYEFKPTVRLPWTFYKKVATGGTGTVYQIKIHPGHHNYRSPKVSQLFFPTHYLPTYLPT